LTQYSTFSSETSAALALDIAAEIWPIQEIFTRHGLDRAAGEALLATPQFISQVETARREWGSLTNSAGRIRVKAAVALEDSIQELYAFIRNKEIPGAARVSAFKELRELSGISMAAAAERNAAEAPTVNIYLSGHTVPSLSVRTTPARSRVIDAEAEEVEALDAMIDGDTFEYDEED
jgi:hypothetical protein